MKVLKYGFITGIVLLLSLGTAAAQSASGQTKPVVPKHPQPLPALDTTVANQQADPTQQFPFQSPGGIADAQDTLPVEPAPEKGVAPPENAERWLAAHEYDKAVQAFEAFADTVAGDKCHILYACVVFYDRMKFMDMDNAAQYESKRDAVLDDMASSCPGFIDFYLMKAYTAQEPQEALQWMDKAIAGGATTGTAYTMRANVLWALGKTKKACADYKKAAAQNHPEAVSAWKERCTKNNS